MTFDRTNVTSIQRIKQRIQKNMEFAKKFVCPLKKGQPVSCWQDSETLIPQIQAPYGNMECPVHETEECEMHRQMMYDREKKKIEANIIQMKRLNVPQRYWDASFQTGYVTPALNIVQAFLNQGIKQGRCLVLLGPTGIGKTYACIAGLRATRAQSAKYFFVPELADELNSLEKKNDVFRECTRTQFAVFDNLTGKYLRPGGSMVSHLQQIITVRQAEMLPTIFTSTLMPAYLKSVLTKDTRDRLNGDWADIRVLQGESLRIKTKRAAGRNKDV